MKILLVMGTAYLACGLAAFGQTPSPTPHARSAQSVLVEESPHLGVSALDISSDRAKALKLKEESGAEVTMVEPDSAAAKAGDVITKIDDTAISTPQQISGALRGSRGKGPVTVTVVRSRKEVNLTVTPDSNGYYRGGVWDPKDNILLQLFQPFGQKDKQ